MYPFLCKLLQKCHPIVLHRLAPLLGFGRGARASDGLGRNVEDSGLVLPRCCGGIRDEVASAVSCSIAVLACSIDVVLYASMPRSTNSAEGAPWLITSTCLSIWNSRGLVMPQSRGEGSPRYHPPRLYTRRYPPFEVEEARLLPSPLPGSCGWQPPPLPGRLSLAHFRRSGAVGGTPIRAEHSQHGPEAASLARWPPAALPLLTGRDPRRTAGPLGRAASAQEEDSRTPVALLRLVEERGGAGSASGRLSYSRRWWAEWREARLRNFGSGVR